MYEFCVGPFALEELLGDPLTRLIYSDWLLDSDLGAVGGEEWWRRSAAFELTPWTVGHLPWTLRWANGRRTDRIASLTDCIWTACVAYESLLHESCCDAGTIRLYDRQPKRTTVVLAVAPPGHQVAVSATVAKARPYGNSAWQAWSELVSGHHPISWQSYLSWWEQRNENTGVIIV